MNNVTQERWKPIQGYEGFYEISDHGNVRSLVGWNGHEYVNRVKMLKLSLTSTGYWKIGLKKNKRTKEFKVHRLVAMAFVPNPCPDKYTIINHKDCNPLNNHYTNLEWCDQSYNVQYGYDVGSHKKKFTLSKEELEHMYLVERMSVKDIAEVVGVKNATVTKYFRIFGIKKRPRSKYGVTKEIMYEMISNGMSTQEIVDSVGCSRNYVGTYRYQMKKSQERREH